MTKEEREVMQEVLNTIELAVLSGDWLVDGACDPTSTIVRMRRCLANDALDRKAEDARKLGLSYD